MKSKTNLGFTIIELLVVVAVIGLLASVVLVSLNSVRLKARDAKRAADMNRIYTALNVFYDQNGCLPLTTGSTCPGTGAYSEGNAGGWDYSSQGGFLQFLQNSGILSGPPLDPINNMTGDGTPAGTYAYKYYCYPQGYVSGNSGLHLGYWRESDGSYIIVNVTNSNYGPGILPWSDSNFLCQ